VCLFQTPACPRCGKPSLLTLDERAVDAWEAGTLIQDAFPNKTAAEREQIKTGFHPECWKQEFGEEK